MKSGQLLCTWVAALAVMGGACSNGDGGAKTGGNTSPGSTGTVSTGGTLSGGTTVASGGTAGAQTTGVPPGTGGATTQPLTGGTTSAGGSTEQPPAGGSTGGRTAAGGATTTGGQTGTMGGATSAGGATSEGGGTGTAGTGVGGRTGAGGRTGTGGRTGAGGTTGPAGGATTAVGGTTASGGTTGAGGATSTDPREPGNAPVPSAGCGKAPTITNGVKTMTSAGLSRQYTIDIPTDYDDSKPYKLFIGYHWMGATMQNVVTGNTVSPANSWNWYGLKRLDTSREYIYVAPQGIDNGWANTDGRDLAFTDDMVKAFKGGLCIDESRIFAGGFSYGGMWSSTLSCQRGNVFRALSPQNGSAGCQTPVSKVAFICFGSNDGSKTSLLTLARTHAKNNGCADANQSMPQPEAGSLLHTCTSFTGCPAAFPVRYCAFDQNHKSSPYDGGCAECDDGNKTWVPGE
ncbi:MAG: hypothetical protein JXP73_01565, partial [Deltaproteobacteria bacterium]|nr:hypothetical protein [Deltaproteobacteria bacterium]